MKFTSRTTLFLIFCFLLACRDGVFKFSQEESSEVLSHDVIERKSLSEIQSKELQSVLASAHEQTNITKNYTQEYIVIPYPNGDVPAETGACTDVLIRAFRKAGVDLQKEVHEDMAANFPAYPKNGTWPKPTLISITAACLICRCFSLEKASLSRLRITLKTTSRVTLFRGT